MRYCLTLVLIFSLIVVAGCNRSQQQARTPVPDQAPSSPRGVGTAPPANEQATKGQPDEATDGEADADAKNADEATEAPAADEDQGEDAKDEPSAPKDDKAGAKSDPQGPYVIGSRGRPKLKMGSSGAGGGGAAQTAATDEVAGKGKRDEDDKAGDDEPAKGDSTSSKSSDTDTPVSPPANTAPAAEASLFDLAEREFAALDEGAAFQLLYAYAITDPDALKKYGMNWYDGLTEPRVALRWGIGVEYEASSDLEGDPPVIGDAAPEEEAPSGGAYDDGPRPPARGGAAGLSVPKRRPISGPPAKSPAKSADEPDFNTPTDELLYYTGDYGRLLLKRLEMRRLQSEPYWGQLLAAVSTENVEVASSSETPAAGSDPPEAAPKSEGKGSSRANVSDLVRSPLVPGASPSSGPLVGLTSPAAASAAGDKTSLQPGVFWVGRGSEADLLTRAGAAGVDVLIIFDVSIRDRNGSMANTTRPDLYLVKSSKMLLRGQPLNSVTVAADRAEDSDADDDPVEVALDKLFKDYVDTTFRAGEMKDVSAPGVVDKRIQFLLSSEPANPLPALVEITYYFQQGLIDKAAYGNAARDLLGEENARLLVDGSADDKKQALSEWISGGQSSGDGSFR
jgi:hypothetical protein